MLVGRASRAGHWESHSHAEGFAWMLEQVTAVQPRAPYSMPASAFLLNRFMTFSIPSRIQSSAASTNVGISS